MEENDNNTSLDERIASQLMITESMSIEQLRELIQLIVLFILEPAASDFQNGLSSYIENYNINAATLKNIVRSLIGSAFTHYYYYYYHYIITTTTTSTTTTTTITSLL